MTKTKKMVAGILTGIIAISSSVLHAETKPVGSGPNPFVDCGIGAALFPDTHWAAVTSNIIWDIGTTAVTSATASPETCSGKDVQTAQFILDNYDNLAEETAKGQGEHLAALLEVRGCQANSHSQILQTVREEMTEIVSHPEYANQEKIIQAASYYNVLKNTVSNKYASQCSA